MNKSKKQTIIFILSLIAIFATSWLELHLQRRQNHIGLNVNKVFLFLLINAHVILSLVLFYLIIRHCIKLFIERRQKTPGSIFKRNLLFAFIIFSVVPTCFVFFTAKKLITTSIERWFQGRIGTGLQSSISVHEHHAKNKRDAIQKAGAALIQKLENSYLNTIDQDIINAKQSNPILTKYDIRICIPHNKKIYGSITKEFHIWRKFRKINDRSIKSLKNVFLSIIKTHSSLEHVFDFFGSLYWSKKIALKNTSEKAYLVIAHRYPKPIRKALIELQKAIIDYESLKSMKNTIYWNYFATLILFTLLIIFLSIWCAFYLAKGISKPIQTMFSATEKIRHGIWDTTIKELPGNDMQKLIVGFNQMTKTIQTIYKHLEQKNHIQSTILENIKESVFFVNNWGRILTFNAASKNLVTKYLQLERFKNQKVNFFGDKAIKLFFEIVKELRSSNKKHLTKEITFSHKGEQKSFIIHTSVISKEIKKSEYGLLVMIEDLTVLLKINKIKTWQEAAKQMAHEIKNPLTPIQLATQRLSRKLNKEYGENLIVTECTDTILNQVAIIKDLIAHFLEFAQLPEYKVENINLNSLIKDVINLYEISYPDISFVRNLQDFIPNIKTDPKKIKRVIINLIDNSIRALQKNKSQEKRISVKTIFKPKRNHMELLISDNGPGIPREVKEKLFLPYVSSSSKNMGLGLAIVHEIISQAGGTIKLIENNNGTTFQIILPI